MLLFFMTTVLIQIPWLKCCKYHGQCSKTIYSSFAVFQGLTMVTFFFFSKTIVNFHKEYVARLTNNNNNNNKFTP